MKRLQGEFKVLFPFLSLSPPLFLTASREGASERVALGGLVGAQHFSMHQVSSPIWQHIAHATGSHRQWQHCQALPGWEGLQDWGMGHLRVSCVCGLGWGARGLLQACNNSVLELCQPSLLLVFTAPHPVLLLGGGYPEVPHVPLDHTLHTACSTCATG